MYTRAALLALLLLAKVLLQYAELVGASAAVEDVVGQLAVVGASVALGEALTLVAVTLVVVDWRSLQVSYAMALDIVLACALAVVSIPGDIGGAVKYTSPLIAWRLVLAFPLHRARSFMLRAYSLQGTCVGLVEAKAAVAALPFPVTPPMRAALVRLAEMIDEGSSHTHPIVTGVAMTELAADAQRLCIGMLQGVQRAVAEGGHHLQRSEIIGEEAVSEWLGSRCSSRAPSLHEGSLETVSERSVSASGSGRDLASASTSAPHRPSSEWEVSLRRPRRGSARSSTRASQCSSRASTSRDSTLETVAEGQVSASGIGRDWQAHDT